MHEPVRFRGNLGARLGGLVLGLFLFATGTVALLESRLGLSAWDMLHQGIARHLPLSFGEANLAVSIAVLGTAWMLGAYIGVGTVANAVLVGAFVQLLTTLSAVTALAQESLAARPLLLPVGLALLGAGSGRYFGAGLGAGPRDSLMVVCARKTSFRIGAVRALIEASALTVGWALGGTVGIGTVLATVGIGPSVEFSIWLLARSPFASGRPQCSSA